MQVRPPCNYVANAVSLRYHPCKFLAMGVDFDEHGVWQNWRQRKLGKSPIGAASTHNFGCVRGTKKSFFYFLPGNSSVQPLLLVTLALLALVSMASLALVLSSTASNLKLKQNFPNVTHLWGRIGCGVWGEYFLLLLDYGRIRLFLWTCITRWKTNIVQQDSANDQRLHHEGVWGYSYMDISMLWLSICSQEGIFYF